MKKIRIVFLGAPGCGKGTQSFILKEQLNLCHLSTGDMLREAVAKRTEIGLAAKAIMDRGDLVSDEIVLTLVENAISTLSKTNGFILDGFPRTIVQAQKLDALLKKHDMELSTVFVFNIDINNLIQRICGRLIHPGSGRIYHETFSPPNVVGKDNITGENLIKRPDDTEENVRKRYQLYQTVTAPLVEYYNRKEIVHILDATLDTKEINRVITSILAL